MRVNYFLIVLFLFSFAACSKDDTDDNGGDGPRKQYPTTEVTIHQSLFLNLKDVKERNSDTKMMDSLIHYIEHVPKGETFHMSIYLFDYRPLMSAVVRAINRGVVANILIDNSHADESKIMNQSTITALRSAVNNTPSTLIAVDNNITAISINHQKYVIFSKIALPHGEAKNVVFSTSHNFQISDTRKVQDAIVMTNKGLYEAFLRNWNDIAALADSGMKNFSYKVENVGDSIKAIFLPRRSNGAWDGKDPIMEVLNKLTNFSSKDTIFVGMAGFTNPRVSIAEKLVSLQKNGVRVEVVTRAESGSDVLNNLGQLAANGGYVKLLTTSQVNIHAKFMLIKGYYEGKHQTIILCGSQNYSGNALYNNNEQTLMLMNSSLFNNYWNHFKDIKQTL